MGSCISLLGGRICGLIDKAKSCRASSPSTQMDDRKRLLSRVTGQSPSEKYKRICVQPSELICTRKQDNDVNISRENSSPELVTPQGLQASGRLENRVSNVTGSDVSLFYDDDGTYINSLPRSLLIQIFQNLSMFDLLQRACLVCKYWLQLSHDPDLWRHVNVQGMLKVDDAALKELTSYSDNVTQIDITDSRLITSAGVIQVLSKCKKLQVFKAARCQQLTDPAFAAIGDFCHHLTRLHLDNCFALTDQALIEIAHGCEHLKYLQLNQCFHITDNSILQVAKSCQHLLHILLDQCHLITDKSVMALSEHCLFLEDASFMGCDFTEEGIISLSKCCHLKTLELSNIRRTSVKAVKQLILHCKELTSLNLCLCNNINDECVEFMAKYGKKLCRLQMVSCNISDEALYHIGHHSTTLEHVDVGWCDKITDQGVKMIASTLKSLQFLGLIRCDKVTISTMEELVVQYPAVTFSTVYLDFKRLVEKAKDQGFITEDQIPSGAVIHNP